MHINILKHENKKSLFWSTDKILMFLNYNYSSCLKENMQPDWPFSPFSDTPVWAFYN